MKRTPVFFVVMLTAIALWMIAGCSSTEEPGVNDDLMDREQVVDLNDPYGGLNFGDEDPAFGDAAMTEAFGPELDADYSDPMEDDPVVAHHRERNLKRNRPVTYLMITWGNLEADSLIDFPTDWTGSLTAENGALCLKRTIAWDPEDKILPRVSRDKLEWISFTKPHFDGILVALHKIAPPDTSGDDSTSVAALDDNAKLSITFRTGPLTVTIDEENLRDLHRVVTVDDAGNAVAFNTFSIRPQGCPQGFMAGRWRPVDHRPGGIFRGKWLTHNGMHVGYLRGVYGPTAEGDNVFFGKWIKHNGQFQGLLVGYYGNNDAEPGGWYKGVWLKRNLEIGGRVHGVWNTRDDAEKPGGFFKGRWKKECGNATDPK
jgi:hypothetical protein